MAQINTYFTNIDTQIQQELDKAKYSIRVAMYNFTNLDLFNKLCEKAKNGVEVELILSPSPNNKGINFVELVNNGGSFLYCKTAGAGYSDPIMHNKFCVIDFKTVITGSFNWTNKGVRKNDENIVIITDEITSQKYIHKFNSLKKESWLYEDSDETIQISFSASKSIVKSGEQVDLIWKVSNTEKIEISDLGVFDCEGTKSIEIFSNQKYTLTASNQDQTKQKTVSILLAKKPIINFFQISKNLIRQGQTVELSWSVENAEIIEIDNGIGQVMNQGNKILMPNLDTAYTLTAIGINEEDRKIQTIKVVDFPIPVIKTLTIPKPEIKIQIPSRLILENSIANIVLSVPQISTINNALIFPTLKHIKQEVSIGSIKKDIVNHKRYERFKKIKKFIFDNLQNLFLKNPKVTEIIKTIRKNYE